MPLYGGITLPNRPDPENVRKLDLLAVPMARAMMRHGLRIDMDAAAALSSRLSARQTELRRDITSVVAPADLDRFMAVTGGWDADDDPDDTEDRSESEQSSFNLDSAPQIRALLYDVLHLDRTVKTKKTKSGLVSTGKKTLEQLKREHPVVPLILEYRECSKLDGTYARAMPRRTVLHPRGPDCARCGRHHWTDEWRVHTQILLTRTATGRKAFKAPNLGNIPLKSALGREIRALFIAGEGMVIADADWAQIELRLLADLSGDASMIVVYEHDGDIHVATAMDVFEIADPAQVDKLLHRLPCKTVNFAVVYGLQAPGLLDNMANTYAVAGLPPPNWLTERWCEGFIDKWFGARPGVKRYLDAEESSIRRHGAAWTRCGRVRRIPNVRSTHRWIQEAGIREGRNHGVQGWSADLMNLAMGELTERLAGLAEAGIESWPAMTIYDALMIETEEDNGESVLATMLDVMEHVLDDRKTGVRQCKVPVKADGDLLKVWRKKD